MREQMRLPFDVRYAVVVTLPGDGRAETVAEFFSARRVAERCAREMWLAGYAVELEAAK